MEEVWVLRNEDRVKCGSPSFNDGKARASWIRESAGAGQPNEGSCHRRLASSGRAGVLRRAFGWRWASEKSKKRSKQMDMSRRWTTCRCRCRCRYCPPPAGEHMSQLCFRY
ncbi:hypothetical protein CKAH01_07344 [Colletotrichum kahawae]|uniref:Uncharacterized protein n=1 Tax=Colletotrichum kahawae TaxID=34407 RepID=A0AAE0D1R4_COLKA|nr:hypothetical protein CKAH01_07344 [Colletotrichum kahawae]